MVSIVAGTRRLFSRPLKPLEGRGNLYHGRRRADRTAGETVKAMAAQPHIIVVDDEAEVRDMVREYLGANGFSVAAASGGVELRELLGKDRADLVILDVMMPGEDGFSLARYVRENYATGIIMLTAVDGVVDRVVGLEIGADDYITKPFDPRELLARVKSVIRRLPGEKPRAEEGSKPANAVRFGRCILNLESHRMHDLDGTPVPLTSMEFDLLKAFAERPNRVLSRDQLLELAHNRDWEPFDRSIDIRINRLRRKVEPDPAKPQTLKTVRGAGYIFVPAEEDA